MPRKPDTAAVPPASAAPAATSLVDGQKNFPPAQRRIAQALEQYECGPVRFSGDENASYERHLVFDNVVDPADAEPRQKFEAVARSLRDLLSQRWIKTTDTYDRANPKRVYYLSMEFLIGRSLTNNIPNLLVEPIAQEAMKREKLDLMELAESEPDAGLGNGGLGRLAACFIDSMATLQMPAIGYGLRYEYGIFRQEIRERLSGRKSRQLAASARSVGGRPPLRAGGSLVECPRPFAKRRGPRRRQRARIRFSAFPTIGRSSATAARRSTRCGCGEPPTPTISTSASSIGATFSPPCTTRSPPRI